MLGVTLKTDRKPDIWLEDYNVKGNNLTLKALNGALGRIAGTVTIDLTDLANLDRDSKLALMAADPNDVKFYDAGNNLIAPGDKTTLAKYAVIFQPDEIDVEAGTINAEAGNDVFLSSVSEVGIGRIKGGQVRIRSDRGIFNGANDGSVNIISDDLVLIAENGAIGEADKALALAIKDGSLLRALARDGIYLDQREAGTNRSGNLNIAYIHTPGNVSLQAASSIIRTNTGNAFDIICAGLNLAATGGAIGSAADSLKIEQADGSSLKAIAGTNIFLEELTGNMKVDLISAGGDVNLRTPGSILAAANDEHTAVTGNNINLTASNGQVGEKDIVLVINSSCASPGLVEVNALGDVYIKEAAGNLNLGLIRSISKGRVFIASAGGITNGIGAGTNVDANILKIEAVSGVGTLGSPIHTSVTRVEGSGGSGGFYLDNQGGLTVGGVDTINGIQADGNIQLIAHSPITIAEDLAAGGDINITAGSSAGLDDLVIAQDRKVQAGGLISLTAGDSILINPNALVKAGTTVDAQASGDLILTTATVDGGGTVSLKGVSIPITANSLIKAGGAMSI
ncbi:MAG: hypothetical protein PHE82_07510, partial [Syntrophomonadaceae bacterium]|nr:hypothetical protein [Syntrophomonadaceae bacterium]